MKLARIASIAIFLALSATATKLPTGSHASAVARVARGLSSSVTSPDYSIYHRKDELLQKVQELVRSNQRIFRMEMRNASDAEYGVEMMVVTADLGGVDSDTTPKMRFLMDFGEHARELISSELGLALLRTLASPDAVRAVLGGGKRGEDLYNLVKEEVAFKILPMENTRGRDLLEREGRLCERKNGRGVDPNRNWEVDWGKKEKDYDPNEEYPGTKPFSEPEVQIVLSLAQTFKPHVWLNIHSGMEAMFTPWDHQDKVPPAAQEALAVLQTLQRELFAHRKDCVVGSGGKTVGYLAHGTATDYMFEKLKVPMPFTWEIFGDLQADYHDCFKMFNPVTRAQFDDTIQLWLRSLFRLIELTPKHSVIAAQLQQAREAAQKRQKKKQQEERRQEEQTQKQQGPGPGLGEPEPPVLVMLGGQEQQGSVHGWGTWAMLGVGMVGLAALLVGAARYLRSSPSDSLSALGRKARASTLV